MESLKHCESGDDVLRGYSYTVYADGMRSTVTDFTRLDGATEDTIVAQKQWQYDNLNRLLIEYATSSDEASTDAYDGQYEYGLTGNRTNRVINVNGAYLQTVYTYNSLDQLETEVDSDPYAAIPYGEGYAYVYAKNGRLQYYMLKNYGKVGHFRAFVLGLPSKWSQYLFRVVLLMLPLVFLLPVFGRIYLKIRRRGEKDNVIRLSLFKRCLCVLLCYTVLTATIGIEQIAEGATLYHELTRENWGTPGDIITYEYDDNGSLWKKHYGDLSAPYDQYSYNLQNRLVTFTPDGGDSVNYKYNPDGIRVEKTVGTSDPIQYLIDAQNHTGYAQVFEEKQGASTTSYILGSDVVGKYTSASDITYYVYDGHGSVRHHLDHSSGAFANYEYTGSDQQTYNCDTFSYDAYGHRTDPLKNTLNEGLFYAGEIHDSHLDQYYLRARYYNPNNGLFNRTDPYSGNLQDPQSLHKYLYCHDNPINAIDPSGTCTFIQVAAAISITSTILSVVIPVVTGVIVSVRAGISPWEYFSELFSGATWKEALIALGVGAAVSAVIKPLIKSLGKRVFAFMGMAFSLYSLFMSIRLSAKMAKNTTHLSRAEIAHYLAVLTASIILAIVLGKIARHIAEMRGKGYRRPYLRKKLQEEVIANAKKTADGRFIDPKTKKIIEGKYHFGHTFSREHRRLVKEALGRGMTQKEFNNWINSHPEWFQIEDPFTNMSHILEKPG